MPLNSLLFDLATGKSILQTYHGTISLLILVTAILVTRFLSSLKKKKENESLPPLPPKGPLFAEFLKAQTEGRLVDCQQEWVKQYGSCFTIPGIVPDFVAIAHVGLTKELCIKQANQYRNPCRFTTRTEPFAKAVRAGVGTSLTGTTGQEWKWRRDAFLKEMHKSKLFQDDRQLLNTFRQVGEELCQKLQHAAESGQVVQTDILATEAALDVILFFLFGKRLTGYNAKEIRRAAKDILAYMFGSLMNPLTDPILEYVPFTLAYERRRKRNAAWAVFDSLIHDEIVTMIAEARGGTVPGNSNNQNQVDSKDNCTPPPPQTRLSGSFLESWFATEPKFYNRGLQPILSETRVLILAGFETTAHALAYAFGMMAQYPEWADQLYHCSKEALQNGGDLVKAMEQSSLVKNFFMEALRLYPLAQILAGECLDDIVIEFEGNQYGLPKKTQVVFFNFSMQRNPGNEIDPNQWDKDVEHRPFLNTFNTGPHTCPGKPLSLLEGHLFLLQVASRFTFSFPDGIDRVLYDEEMLLRPKDAMPLRVQMRK